jgi:hypothetical protein
MTIFQIETAYLAQGLVSLNEKRGCKSEASCGAIPRAKFLVNQIFKTLILDIHRDMPLQKEGDGLSHDI